MLKKNVSVLTAFLLVLMLFSGCVPALPANLEDNSAIIKPGTTYIGTESIYRGVWSSFIGPTYARYEITEDSVIYKYDVYSEEKVFPVEKWEWQEFPYTQEEWKALFEIPEFYLDIFQYGKIMYQPINEFVSLLLVDGEILCMNISLINSEDYPLQVTYIEHLTPADSCGRVQFEYAPAMSSKEPFLDFEIRTDFSRIMASGSNLVDIDKPYFQLGSNIAIDDHDFIRWSPADYDGVRASGAEINFQIFQNGDNTSWVYDGKIMIETVESEDGKTLYEATLLAPDLMMERDENTGKVYIYDPDTYLGNDEITVDSGSSKESFWDWVPFG